MKYDNDQLAELCSKFNLLEYAQQKLEFKKHTGNIWFCNCPVHKDDTDPSMAFYEETNTFHCHACGVGKSPLDFFVKVEGMQFNEAVDKMAELTGSDVKKLKSCESLVFYKKMYRLQNPKQDTKPIVREILSPDYYDRFSPDLPTEWIDEGISAEALRKYEIRVDNSSRRIVYPVYDMDLNLIGVKGRTRFKEYKALNIAKYMNYTKIGTTDFFMGWKQNKENILSRGEVIIFEGIKSCMKAFDYGTYNTLAAETSKLNDEQIKWLLKLRIKDVIIAFDSDVSVAKIRECCKGLKRFTNVWVVPSDKRLLGEKAAPVDVGVEVWYELLSRKFRL